jgi:general secretion pathway protein K
LTNRTGNQDGIALVVTLLALVLITAMVVEFAYGVYTGINNLYNWRDSQRLSLMAKSGVSVSTNLLSSLPTSTQPYSGSREFPVQNPFEDFSGTVTVKIEDESSKLSLRSLVAPNGIPNDVTYNSFQRLLEVLSLDKKIADKVVDWIRKKREAGVSTSGNSVRDLGLVSVDELLLINGITKKDYDTLLPYITVYGSSDNLIINVNGAGKPVLMSIYDKDGKNGTFPITEDSADRIIKRRELSLFSDYGDFNSCAGTNLASNQMTTYVGPYFSIRSMAEFVGEKRIIQAIFNKNSGKIEYWKEY